MTKPTIPGADAATDDRALFEVEMRKKYGQEHFQKYESQFDGICYLSARMEGAFDGWNTHAAIAAGAPANTPSVAREVQTWQSRVDWTSDERAAKLMVEGMKAEIADLRAALAAHTMPEAPSDRQAMTHTAMLDLCAQNPAIASGLPLGAIRAQTEAPESAAFCTDGGTPMATYTPPKLEHDWEAEPVQQGAQELADTIQHPVQPLVHDAHGRLRFKRNAIVDFLADGRLNDLAAMEFDAADWEQLAQLIGYSLSGFGELSYVTDEAYERAAAQAPTSQEPQP